MRDVLSIVLGIVFINTLKASSASSNHSDASAMSSETLKKAPEMTIIAEFYLEKVTFHCTAADASNVPPAKLRDRIKSSK